MRLEGGKFVLVGGAGLIGSHTLDLLLAAGAGEVVVFGGSGGGNLGHALGDPRVKTIRGDVTQPDMVEAAFDGADGVFHLAAMWLLHCQQLPSAAFEVNIRGTFNVMDACVKKGVKRLVFSSSRSAYGGAAAELVHEEDPLLASDFYGASKTAGEALLHAYHHRYGLDYAALRYMNVYGPRQAWRGPYISVIMKMLTAIEAGQGPTIIGEGSERFDFVAVEDCALANLCAMGSDATDRAYNVGTGQATTLRDLAELLLELTGSDLPINFVKSDAVTTSRGTVASTERAAAEIGFEATIPLRKGLARLIDWRAQEMRRAGL